jgi:ABC-2 type transport system permease protein
VRLVLLHTRATTVELVRYPAFLVPTLLFPAAFFLVFAVPSSRANPDVEMATFAGFAVIGVAFFQFGVGIATERASPWETYLRTLAVGPGVRLGARVVSAVLFATASAALLAVVAAATTPVSLPAGRWVGLALVLLVGAAPFALLGIALGYLVPPRGALPVANLLYLALAYAGGLWMRPRDLPSPVAAVSPYLPTRALGDLLAATADGRPLGLRAAGGLALFTIGFAALAAVGFRRDEGRNFR